MEELRIFFFVIGLGLLGFIGFQIGYNINIIHSVEREAICIQAGCEVKDCKEWIDNPQKVDRLKDYCIKVEVSE